MAGNVISVALSVTDPTDSLAKQTGRAKALNVELEKVRKTSAAAKFSPAGENIEYGRGRGAMGATGAGARDFANQAQGLGGVVRLYATWAANIFAVGAAFSALSEAANTSNMVQGMNQLSAATGVAMGNMAKRFAEASGGAISLREAMEATTKAVSSGLSQEQFDKLGQVATKASRALGVGMSDAVSRLTRGITKLEPELLDELGIFTKVGKATDDYAKSVGKSASSLTDFEKRQAFANAVLDEGLKKFGEIKVDANPYDQLAASLRNLTQSGLEMANKVLGPLIGALSTSPTALTVAVAGLATMLVKQAIPAVGQYRESLARSLDEAKGVYEQKAKVAKAIGESAVKNALSGIDNVAQVAADKAAERLDILETLVTKNQSKFGKTVKDILKVEDLTDISESQIQTIEKFSKSNKGLSKVYSELALSIREAKTAREEYTQKEQEALAIQKKKDASILSDVTKSERELKSAKAALASRAIVSQASADVGTDGIFGALKNLKKNITETPDMGPIRKGFTGIAGAASIATTAITRVVGALSGFFGWIGAAVAVFATLDGIFSKNSAEVTKFGESVGYFTDAVKVATDVNTRWSNSLTTESITAKANAIDGLSNGIRNMVTDLEKADKSANFWDRQIDAIKDLFGYGLKDKFRDALSGSLETGLATIDNPKTKAIAEEKLKAILNVKDLKIETIQKALDKLDPKAALAAGKAIQQVFGAAATEAMAAKSALQSVSDAFKGTETAVQGLANSLKSNDPISNYADAIAKQGFAMKEAFKSPEVALASLRDIMKDVSKIKLFPPETAGALLAARDSYMKLEQDIARAEAKQRDLNAMVSELKVRPTLETTENYAIRTSRLKTGQSMLAAGSNNINDLKAQQAALVKSLGDISSTSIAKGFDLVLKQSGFASAAAALNNTKSLVDMLSKTPETLKASADLDKQRIGIEIQQLTLAQYQLNELKIMTKLQEKAMAENSLRELKSNADARDGKTGVMPKLEAQIKAADDIVAALRKPGGVTEGIKKGTLEKTPETLTMLQEERGYMDKVGALKAQITGIENQRKVKELELTLSKFFEGAKDTLDAATQEFEDKKKSTDFRKLSSEEQYKATEQFYADTEALRELVATSSQRLNSARDELLGNILGKTPAVTSAQEESTRQLGTEREKFTRTEARRKADAARDVTEKAAIEAADKQIRSNTKLLEQASELRTQTEAMSSVTMQEIDLKNQLGQITEAEYTQKVTAEKYRALAAEKEFSDLERKYNYQKQLAEFDKQLVTASGDERARLEEDKKEAATRYASQVAGAQALYDKRKQLLDLETSISNRQKAYSEIFINSINSMADAMVEFVRTGKLDFKSLIDSMLADILRYELRLQYMEAYKSLGGAKGILGMFGIGSGAESSYATASDTTMYNWSNIAAGGSLAKGGAFDEMGSTHMFAKGGTFTNSVVNSPTLFKFAKGTGLMGEAGPEAIMPLKRDANGNLGVRAGSQQPNVTVTVVNNSSEKAETKETTDSRGNRNIEVVIGEMVAGQLAKPNSAMQNTMKGTFGAAPMLTRR